MKHTLKVLIVDASTGFYKIKRYPLGAFYGPVDLGLHLSGKTNSLNIGVGILAGSIFPGSNRLIFTGFSPSWGGFYISSMGGAGLVFDDLGINILSIIGKAAKPSVLFLNRQNGEEIEVGIDPLDPRDAWADEGVYSLLSLTHARYTDRYENDPRVLAVGPASRWSDMGAIVSVPIKDGKLTHVDTWAGRGGFGSKLLQQHGLCAVIYGGSHIDDDFRDRKVADEWFQAKYEQKLTAKDLEATKKYRFDPDFDTGGTFGVNYATNAGSLLAFNYRSIHWTEEERKAFHEKHIKNHYLKQFNEETITSHQFATCGEPCVAVCKKNNGIYKKDYEPYQTFGPLCGIFDQRSAEQLNHQADAMGFDAISAGGMVSWLMDCLNKDLLTPEELGVDRKPRWDKENFDTVQDSLHNAELGISILENTIGEGRKIDLSEGARKFARRLARAKKLPLMDNLLINSFARRGWMVPNQYWTPGVLSPMPAMGRYYMHYAQQYFPPRLLGRINVDRMKAELMLDNLGVCRFHRGWAEEMLPEIITALFGEGHDLALNSHITARRINCRNSSVFWESELNIDYVLTYLQRQKKLSDKPNDDLDKWLKRFEINKKEAAMDYWYEIRKGIDESLGEI
ncbi:MAG TPA: aldehyde ferredoxin oxidoreductase N-terminal domain-containing protein [Candidatus Cloacimonadota bacterium]|nr:aldehyde ferredoxin oxidoreductase N-terminal domain-containing protein [Candidatus Cloacimonadota bacterium]HPS39484.1 aldehyde ferredoxin oxidoreductase N-terminal domain-containing protein [Candidatus Cloacimonadota bacterium]